MFHCEAIHKFHIICVHYKNTNSLIWKVFQFEFDCSHSRQTEANSTWGRDVLPEQPTHNIYSVDYSASPWRAWQSSWRAPPSTVWCTSLVADVSSDSSGSVSSSRASLWRQSWSSSPSPAGQTVQSPPPWRLSPSRSWTSPTWPSVPPGTPSQASFLTWSGRGTWRYS